MVVIFSEKDDQSTSLVLTWLIRYKVPFVRINKGVNLDQIRINISEGQTELLFDNGRKIDLNKVSGYWFRRGGFVFNNQKISSSIATESLRLEVESIQKRELKTMYGFLYSQLDKVKSIGSYSTAGVNKLEVLNYAQEVGLKIPETLITSKKTELLDFQKKNKEIITKAIYEVPILKEIEGHFFLYFTGLVKKEMIDSLPESFFPSLFQKCIEKKYELRTFFLNGKCKTMTIFSQEDQQTKLDFRYYNKKFPNRTVPFKLPKEIELKIKKLMKKIPLNCGSIDMILSKKLEFVFLEVNPVGQFGMTSYPNNFYLERDIAEYLA